MSADIPYSLGGGQSASSSAASECEPQKEISRNEDRKLTDGTRRKNKLAAKFPVFGENSNVDDTDTNNTDKSDTKDNAATD
ncbi:hypothetical protein C0J52_21992 [Blattella germanica]|nr:hypothetical protein C0J52_21992 [Blattella germanica]